MSGVVSTYDLINTAGTYYGGVLAPNGDIHFIPEYATVGQKVSLSGTVSTYSLAYTYSSAFWGGVLIPNGTIYLVPNGARLGEVMLTLPAVPYSKGICCHPFFNKL